MFLDTVFDRIVQELVEPARTLYTQALRDSVGVFASSDSEAKSLAAIAPDQILSPAQLSETYQIGIQDQVEYQIILKKRDVVKFLKEQGRSITPKKDLTAGRYTSAFKRRPAKVGKALVFTYAEVLYLTFHRLVIVLPAAMGVPPANSEGEP